MKIKLTYANHVQSGILHGEIIGKDAEYFYFKQFTDDLVTKIKKVNVKSIEELYETKT
jgi:hypothetical protein